MATYTMQELELETAELLPARETLLVPPLRPTPSSSVSQVGRATGSPTTNQAACRRQRERQRDPQHPQRRRRQRQRPANRSRLSPMVCGTRNCGDATAARRKGRPAAPGRPSSFGVISCGNSAVVSRPIPEGCRSMSAVTQPVSTHLAAPGQTPGETPVSIASPPRLADGVELLGAFKNSAYSKPPSLVRRADGQVIQMSPLLYQVACRIDGSRGADAIAALVSADLGRSLDAEQVSYLITAKLLPLGIVAAEGVPRPLPKANPLFSLRARFTLLPERIANLVGALLRPLFRWPVDRGRGRSMLAVDYWLFFVHGLGGGIEQVLRNPVDLLVVLGLTLVSAAVPRGWPRDWLSLRRRATGRDRRGYLSGLALVLHQRHRLVPAQPGRPTADRPRRPVLQRGLHAGSGRYLRGHLGRDPAPRHCHHALRDAGPAAAGRPL